MSEFEFSCCNYLNYHTLNGNYEGKRFYHISTDEVYGTLEFDGTFFTEDTAYWIERTKKATGSGV